MNITMNHHQPHKLQMVRAHHRAIETEVTSLHFELSSHSYETQLLPHSENLSILRYKGITHGGTWKEGQTPIQKQGGEEEKKKPVG